MGEAKLDATSLRDRLHEPGPPFQRGPGWRRAPMSLDLALVLAGLDPSQSSPAVHEGLGLVVTHRRGSALNQ